MSKKVWKITATIAIVLSVLIADLFQLLVVSATLGYCIEGCHHLLLPKPAMAKRVE